MPGFTAKPICKHQPKATFYKLVTYLIGREFVVKVKADRIMDLFALFLLNIFFEQPISDFLIKCKRKYYYANSVALRHILKIKFRILSISLCS